MARDQQPQLICHSYRVGDYRVICSIVDHELVVLVLQIGHRRDVYK